MGSASYNLYFRTQSGCLLNREGDNTKKEFVKGHWSITGLSEKHQCFIRPHHILSVFLPSKPHPPLGLSVDFVHVAQCLKKKKKHPHRFSVLFTHTSIHLMTNPLTNSLLNTSQQTRGTEWRERKNSPSFTITGPGHWFHFTHPNALVILTELV